jgi:ABC-type oligopeptide transport system substrate-binding subunit
MPFSLYLLPYHRQQRRIAVVATVGLVSAALSACTPASGHSKYFGKTVPPDGQQLRYISGSEPESLDPQVTTGQPEARILLALFDGLTEYDPQTGQPIPALAESWEPNGDNSSFTFHLREARWSDGTAITADDFVYTLRRGLTPAFAARAAYLAYDIANAQAFNEGAVFVRDAASRMFLKDPEQPSERLTLPGDPVAREKALASPALKEARKGDVVPVRAEDVGVEAPDPHTLVVHMRQPTPFFPKLVAHQFFRAVPRRAIEQYGDAWIQPGHMITSGAFTLAEWRPYDAVVVTKSPTYWDAAQVRLDRITFAAVEDLTTMMNLYKAGEVDATYNHTVPASWIGEVRQFRDYMDAPEAGTEYYLFNVTRAPMNDVRVRRALNMAVDKVALARLRRIATPLTTAVPGTIFPGYPAPKGDAFDPERAKALLADAGFRDPAGRFDPSRFPVSEVELTYNTSQTNRLNAEFVQSQWKQNLGVTIPLKNVEFKTFLQSRAALEYKGAARSGWAADYMDPYTFLSMFVVEGGDNGSGWTSPEFVRIVNDANRQSGPVRRDELLAQAEGILLREQPLLPLFAPGTNWLKKPYVKGMFANPLTMHAWKYVYIEHDPANWD